MPYIPNVPFTAIDVGDKLIALLNADPDVQGLIVNSVGVFNPVLDDDPTTVDQTTNISLVVTLAAEGEQDDTMGGYQVGRLGTCNTFAVMVYVWDNTHDRARKRLCVSITGAIRQALMRYRKQQGTTSQGTLWYKTEFRKQARGDVTLYYTTGGFRLSSTLLEVTSQHLST